MPAYPHPFRPDRVLVAVPLVARAEEGLLREADLAEASAADVVEWRIDRLGARSVEAYLALGERLRRRLAKPLLATWRTPGEGGAPEQPAELRHAVLEGLIRQGVADLLDLETASFDPSLFELARAQGVPVLGSRHLPATPPVEEMVAYLCQTEAQGLIPKLATTAADAADVARLLLATAVARKILKGPLITMAMGEAGRLGRVVAGFFGASLTFAMLEEASAPGQLPLGRLQAVLGELGDLLEQPKGRH